MSFIGRLINKLNLTCSLEDLSIHCWIHLTVLSVLPTEVVKACWMRRHQIHQDEVNRSVCSRVFSLLIDWFLSHWEDQLEQPRSKEIQAIVTLSNQRLEASCLVRSAVSQSTKIYLNNIKSRSSFLFFVESRKIEMEDFTDKSSCEYCLQNSLLNESLHHQVGSFEGIPLARTRHFFWEYLLG